MNEKRGIRESRNRRKNRVKDQSIKNTEPEDVGHPQEISGRPVIEKEANEENSLSHTKEKWIARGSG